jgi:type II secretory pathway pseudopilin PulG
MIELLLAMTIANVALLALVAALTSGSFALRDAGKKTTAAALADAQLERYRAISYASIGLDSASLSAANGNATYAADPAWNATQATATCSGLPQNCRPLQSVTGADGHLYRVDSYIVFETPYGARQLKRITVVVRNAQNLTARPLIRAASTVDAAG